MKNVKQMSWLKRIRRFKLHFREYKETCKQFTLVNKVLKFTYRLKISTSSTLCTETFKKNHKPVLPGGDLHVYATWNVVNEKQQVYATWNVVNEKQQAC